jgi:hypothetical protein
MNENKKTVVIYHRADFDGIFCRQIAMKFFGENAGYVGWDYGDPLPMLNSEVTSIYMLDISVEAMMGDSRLTWIDHHKSAIEKYPISIHGYRIDGVAACRLAWQWFNNEFSPENPHCSPMCWFLPTKEAFTERSVREPFAVRLAGEYDIWDKRDVRAELFQHGLRSQDIEPLWPDLLVERWLIGDLGKRSAETEAGWIDADGTIVPPVVRRLLEAGTVLHYARLRENESIIRGAGFTLEFEGLTFLACNAARYNSHLFAAGVRPEHQGLLGFNWAGTKWRISLYGAPGKPDVDLSKIAVKYGGGGHKQACGFEIKTLPFTL